MKLSFLILAASLTPLFSKLPEMTEDTEWLGYFVGWEEKGFDFGIGADGSSVIHPKKNEKRPGHKGIPVEYLLEEEIDGKWVRRRIIEENGLMSETAKGLDPKKPVSVTMIFAGGSKIQWTHAPSRGAFALIPKVLEKKTENRIRVGIEFVMPRLYETETMPEGRELKKMLSEDYVRGRRLKDGKKIRVKFSDLEDDIKDEKYLHDGASAIEVQSNGIMGNTFLLENGDEKSGRIDILTKGPLYNSFRFVWMTETQKLGEKDTYISFGLKE